MRRSKSKFRVQGSGFTASGSRFPVPGSRLPVPGCRFRVHGSNEGPLRPEQALGHDRRDIAILLL